MTNAASRQKASNAKNATAARANTKTQQSKQQMQHSVGASFVLRLVLGLAPEKRAACQTLREILNLDNNARLELAPTTKGLKPISGKSNSSDWSKVNQYKVKHMVKQAQSDKFQEAMQQLGGQHLYDVIRTQLKQIGGAWDDRKDKPSLLAKNTRPRSNSIEKNVLPQKEAERRKEQPAKGAAPAGVKGQIQAGKKNQSMESPKIPPPAPATVKQTKNTASAKKAQVKNATPVKNPLPVKAAPLMGAWAGPIPASIVLSRPSAIVSSAPAMSSRAANGGRAILSRAI
ncbi:Ribosomal RNA-processing protein 8 [Phytophthora cinnamomi]|uniref:Ribosomal RNA-processing protein 8 n=1 Tax=Phytophthora cinnamomi TaxID=4785 RepID=UPI00355A003D|nr:Ribosomal RNA-processing protein 8 [Phytophthora cinnamomi]